MWHLLSGELLGLARFVPGWGGGEFSDLLLASWLLSYANLLYPPPALFLLLLL